MEDEENFNEESEESFLKPDPVKVEEYEEKRDEQIRTVLKKTGGFEDDELKTLYPTREKLREAFKDMQKLRKVPDVSFDGEEGEEPEDDYQLPPAQLREVRHSLRRKKAQKVRHEQFLENEGAVMLGEEPRKVKSLEELLAEDDLDGFGLTKE